MAPSPYWTEARRRGQNIDLLMQTSKSISQIAKILQSREKKISPLKLFYGNLVYHCAIIPDQLSRLKFEASHENDFVTQILDLFESIVSNQAVSQDSSHMDNYSKQRSLNRCWDDLQDKGNDAKLWFINQCLNIMRSPEQHPGDIINEEFRAWEENFRTIYPEDYSQLSSDDFSGNAFGKEPPYVVYSTAESLFTAITKSNNCDCTPKHELNATLRLGTYRHPDTRDRLDFDMFLSLEKSWQETHVRTVRQKKEQKQVHFDENSRSSSPPKKKPKTSNPLQPVDELCKQVEKTLKTSYRLELEVEGNVLFQQLPSLGDLKLDRARPTVSLKEFITHGPLTGKTIRILAVLLSHAVLHLHGTSWLQPTWNASQILFFRRLSSRVPLRPFIQMQRGTERPDSDPSNGATAGEIDYDENTDLAHPFPSLVALASMLMEIYLKTPFEKLAEHCKIRLPEEPNSRTRFLDVSSVFDAFKADEIAENSQFFSAIKNCLDPRIWEDEYGDLVEGEMLRITIYRQIVRPLEDELCAAFTSIVLDKLDQKDEEVDISRWGEKIQYAKIEETPIGTSSHTVNDPRFQQHLYAMKSEDTIHAAIKFALNRPPQTSPFPLPGLGLNSAREFRSDSPTFYDDEESPGAHSSLNYLNWKNTYKEVYGKYIEPFTKKAAASAVRIAVLDTGVDDTHESLDTGQIKAKYNWMTTKHIKSAPDRDGHGTFITSLLIDYAPDAELFIAKIADKKPASPGIIAQAIDMAVDEWKVDIITMSFGYPTNQIEGYSELERAISYAHFKNVLMFAAASNSGANLDRAYPARDTNIICVHSTDSKGNRSRFNPTALRREVNLATIGEAVESAWPVNLCDVSDNPNCVQLKSGTSYATPIAVGIAAFLIQYARIHLADVADTLKRQSTMKTLLMKIAEKTQSSMARDDYDYIFLSLNPDNLFGKPKSFIDHTLREILKG